MRNEKRSRWFVVVFGLLSFSLVGGAAWSQEAKRSTTIVVPKGAKVQVSGKSARIYGGGAGGAGVAGTYQCDCSGGNNGTCTVVTNANNIQCQKGTNGTCTGTCAFLTTATGATSAPTRQ